MNYADIKTVDVQDGTGIRVSIYVSGCHFHCKGCHNKEAWDFNYGKKFDETTIDYIIEAMNHSYISGLSILGGEPLELSNQKALVPLVQKVKEKYPEKTIWCYTGYRFEEDVLGKMYKQFSYTKDFIDNIDIIVDGQFMEEKKIVDLKFRGSINQKKIDVQASLKVGKAIQLKFGDENRYEKQEETKASKLMLFKEFKIRKEKMEKEFEEEKNSTSILNDENKNITEIKPAYQIQEIKEHIAASNIKAEIAAKV